jgi:hypothetical protein
MIRFSNPPMLARQTFIFDFRTAAGNDDGFVSIDSYIRVLIAARPSSRIAFAGATRGRVEPKTIRTINGVFAPVVDGMPLMRLPLPPAQSSMVGGHQRQRCAGSKRSLLPLSVVATGPADAVAARS